jgi:nucleosome assembly protein 1-like 1
VGEEEKGVPQFWLTAMKTNEILAMQITERDEAALKYIKDIKWSNLDENKGFILEFYFDSNPYFKNPMVLPYHFSNHTSGFNNLKFLCWFFCNGS